MKSKYYVSLLPSSIKFQIWLLDFTNLHNVNNLHLKLYEKKDIDYEILQWAKKLAWFQRGFWLGWAPERC